MITVSIGGAPCPLAQVSEDWVNQMIAEARRLNQRLCVNVEVREPGARVMLSTPGCGGGGGGRRPPNELERRILKDWSDRGLQSGDFSPGQLQAFLHELRRLI